MSTSLIERELLSKRHYLSIRHWLGRQIGKAMRPTDLDNLLLRYRFNLVPSATDDPIFITSDSPSAKTQFLKDCRYFKLTLDAERLLQGLQQSFQTAADQMSNAKLHPDAEVVIKDGIMKYGLLSYRDISSLGLLHPHHAFALHLRYDYLKLGTHGLARYYPGAKDAGCEGFASAFNHYYDEWCSLFPDLETVFGSRGPFATQVSFTSPLVYLNPPFDEQVMQQMIDRVMAMLEAGASNTFVLTLPNWADYAPLTTVVTSKWTREVTTYAKGELRFLDHLTGKDISPCGIKELRMSV